MNKVKVLTQSQKQTALAELYARKNAFLQSAVSALKNGVSVKRIIAQLEEYRYRIVANKNCGTIRIVDSSFPQKEDNETMMQFHELHSTREYFIYMLSHGYNVSFNDMEE